MKHRIAILAGTAVALALLSPASAADTYNPYFDKGGQQIPPDVVHGINPQGQAQPSGSFSTITATIANGQSLSGAVDLGAGSARAFALYVPSVWTGTTTSITFQASADGTNYGELYNDTGTEVTVTVTGVSTFVVFSQPVTWLGIRYLKVRSGTAASPVTQGQSTAVIVVAVP